MGNVDTLVEMPKKAVSAAGGGASKSRMPPSSPPPSFFSLLISAFQRLRGEFFEYFQGLVNVSDDFEMPAAPIYRTRRCTGVSLCAAAC
jgi:hypothetical protein